MSMKEFVDLLTSEQRKALLEALTGKEIDTNVQPEPTEEDFLKKNTVNEGFEMSSTASKRPQRGAVRAGTNTWTDEGEHRDVVTPKSKITPRNRKPPRTKDVVCHICQKKFKINPALTYGEYYRCDRCSGNK